MKTSVVFVVSIALVSIFFCHMVMAAPTSMPADLQIVQPDPSLPKELSAFFGKWEGSDNRSVNYFLIVEKIDEEKASLYLWYSGCPVLPAGWYRYESNVSKERGKYKLWYHGPFGNTELTLKGEYLNWSNPEISARLKRVS